MERFPGWGTGDDRRANEPEDPSAVWQAAVDRMDTELDAMLALHAELTDRASCDDIGLASRARDIADRIGILRAEMVRLWREA